MASTVTALDPLTPKTFDSSKVTFDSYQSYDEYNFGKYRVGYKYDSTTNDKLVIKLCDVKVRKAFQPMKDNDGNDKPYPKVFALFELANDEQVKVIDDIHQRMAEFMFEHREKHYPDSHADYETVEDIKDELKREAVFRNSDDHRVIGLNFPLEGFCNPDNWSVKVNYMDKENPPSPDVKTSGQIDSVLSKDSVCDIFIHAQFVKITSTGEYNLQLGVFQKIIVTKYATPGTSGNKKMTGTDCDKFDVDGITLGDIIVNDKKAKSLKPKVKYTNGKGEEKLGSISLHIKDADIYMARNENTDAKTGKVSYSWTMNVRFKDDEADVIDAIENKCYELICKDHKKYKDTPKPKKSYRKGFDNKSSFRTSLRDGTEKSAKRNMYISVFCNNPGDDVPDFCGNFYKPGSECEKYSNEEVVSELANRRHTGVSMNIYVKHIWYCIGFDTLKWAMGNATVDITDAGTTFKTGEDVNVYKDVTDVTPADNDDDNKTVLGGAKSAFTDVGSSSKDNEDVAASDDDANESEQDDSSQGSDSDAED